MEVKLYEIKDIESKKLKFAVILAEMNGEWIFVRNKNRSTWEIPGGRREDGEEINETARRELFEETGALNFNINPICVYAVEREGEESFGLLYKATVTELGGLPEYEIEEICLKKTIPKELTYPEIQPVLYRYITENEL